MSTYTLSELLQLWKRNEVTAEQMVGYLLQHVIALAERLVAQEKRLRHLETLINTKN